MEPEFDREMAEALENAEQAEVVCVILPMINQVLVYDSRWGPEDPPQLAVAPRLGSADRRLRQINQARPHLKHAREMAAIPWLGSIQSLTRSSVWQLLVDRMTASGFDSAEGRCQQVLAELEQWERRAMMAMINGQGPYHTIWSRESVFGR